MRRRVLAACVLTAACCPQAALPDPAVGSRAEPPVPLPPPPPSAETLDEGSFVLTLQGQAAGRERFAIRRRDGLTIEHDSRITIDGVEHASRGTLTTGDDWRPRAASIRGTIGAEAVDDTLVAGPPLTLERDTAGAKNATAASRDVDYFFHRAATIHLTPVCHLSAAAATRVAFPGREVAIAAAVAVPEDAPLEGVIRRTMTIDAAQSLDLYCQGTRLVAVDAPQAGLLAVRAGSEDLVGAVRTKHRVKPPLADGLVELDRKVEVAAGKDVAAAMLACSLVLPASHAEVTARQATGAQAALPAVVFITGTGEHDRDGS